MILCKRVNIRFRFVCELQIDHSWTVLFLFFLHKITLGLNFFFSSNYKILFVIEIFVLRNNIIISIARVSFSVKMYNIS